MEKNSLESLHNRRRQRSLTDSNASKGKDLQNLVRDIEIAEPLQVLSSDISCMRTQEAFECLCQNWGCSGWVELARTMAGGTGDRFYREVLIHWDIPEGCIWRSDQGSQYMAEATLQLLKANGILQIFSRV